MIRYCRSAIDVRRQVGICGVGPARRDSARPMSEWHWAEPIQLEQIVVISPTQRAILHDKYDRDLVPT